MREVVRDNELDYPQAIRLLSGEITLEEIQRNPSAYWTSPRKKAPPKERTQSQKKLMPYLGNLKENLNNAKETINKYTDTKNEKVSATKKTGTDIPTLPKEIVTQIKEQLKIEVTAPTTRINSIVEHSRTSTNTKEHKNLVNRTNSSSLIANTSTYYSSKPVPLHDKQTRSIFTKPPCNSVRNIEKVSNTKLPPRPNYKESMDSFTPRPITNLSSEANKYIGRNNIGQEKSSVCTYRRLSADGPEITTEVKFYKPPKVPSYARNINPHSTRNGHGSSISITQYLYRSPDIPGGSHISSRNYGGFDSSVSGRVWAPKLY